eukprot:6173502-Pleurochrysis_carterae.AAC.1
MASHEMSDGCVFCVAAKGRHLMKPDSVFRTTADPYFAIRTTGVGSYERRREEEPCEASQRYRVLEWSPPQRQ